MHGILCNLPEVWTHMNKHFDVSDMGNIRFKESKAVLKRYKGNGGYAQVSIFRNQRHVHPFVLKTFIPKPSPMFNMCDHIDRNRMNPELVNLRWSNIVLNGLNKGGVRGYQTNENNGIFRHYPRIRLLGSAYRFKRYPTPEEARAIYEYWQSRAYVVIEMLCSRDIHWKFQQMVLSYWIPVVSQNHCNMRWERDEAYSWSPVCGRQF